MGVSSSLYSSISGLSSMGEAMSVLGDNVANVNTISFKSSRTTFQDVLTQSVSTASGAAQVGRGVTLSTVSGLFAQGSFESSSSATDMAIGGQGFFMLRSAENAEYDMFTRAGEFSFDQEGYVVNPQGYYVQGWTIDSSTGERAGSLGDILIDKTTPPVATKEIQVISNLDARLSNEMPNETRLFDSWNATNAYGTNPSAPIDAVQYDYTTSIKIYDSKGASHDITVFFDRTTQDNEWEFLVTCDPSEDERKFMSLEESNDLLTYAPYEGYDYSEHKGAGALMYGVLQFDTNGNLTEIEAYDVPADGEVNPALDDNRKELDTTDTYFSFDVNFTGAVENDSIDLNLGAAYDGGQTDIAQTLVSDDGARESPLAGADPITGETLWANVYDGSNYYLSGDGTLAGSSDTITINGFDKAGERKSLVYYVNNDEKVQDFLDEISGAFNASASIDSSGRLVIADTGGGPSGLSIVDIIIDGDNDQPDAGINDNATLFGGTALPSDVLKINIATTKRQVISRGQMLDGNLNAVTNPSTLLTGVRSAVGVATIDIADEINFTGFKGDATNSVAVDVTFVVADGDTIQDLLTFLEESFDAEATVDGAGRLVLSDRLADAIGGYESSLEIDDVDAVVGTTVNPWSDAAISVASDSNDPLDASTWGASGVNSFYTVEAHSAEDGSIQGASVSSSFSPEALASTQYANSSTTIFQDQNGFASGYMQSISVDTDGVMTGNYSNGQVLKKAQVGLANFGNLAGLHKKGGNIYTMTTDSGKEVFGAPGENGLGSIAPNALEMSNVDLGAEFVKLITVQRGFQANSKIITTTDEMMSDLINMKR